MTSSDSSWHPHIHSICLYGAVDKIGDFHQLPSIDTDYLTRTFADNVYDALLERELIDEHTVQSMKAWQHSGFNVWLGKLVLSSDRDARKFLAHYLKKSPISLPRLACDVRSTELTPKSQAKGLRPELRPRVFGTSSGQGCPLPDNDPPPKPSPLWAACMKRIFELDPLVCPR